MSANVQPQTADAVSSAIVPYVPPDIMPVIGPAQMLARREAVIEFVKQVMVKDRDYGVIPGTSGRLTLYKDGAEKLCHLFGYRVALTTSEKIQDWDRGFFQFICTASLYRDGVLIATAEGECNSMEKKYRYRTVSERKATLEEKQRAVRTEERESQYDGSTYTILVLENDDPYSLVNTILKMAQKRALMGAVGLVVSAGDIFDLTDESDGRPASGQRQTARRASTAKTANGNSQKPATVTIKTNAWVSECQSLARDVPVYANDKGQPDYYKIQGSVLALGVTAVTGDNLLDVMDKLRVAADVGDGPPPEPSEEPEPEAA